MKNRLEVACFNTASALIAQANGAHRVEFCADMAAGGITPALEDVRALKAQLTIDLYVMIRPRGGKFTYTTDEFSLMQRQILDMKDLGVHGVVFGVLHTDNSLDMKKNSLLASLASPLPCTLHRAFDAIPGAFSTSIEDAIACGFSTILTSGKCNNVVDGAENLAQLVSLAGNKIQIMPGGGLRSSNVEIIKTKTKATYFHTSGVLPGANLTDAGEIRKILEILLTH